MGPACRSWSQPAFPSGRWVTFTTRGTVPYIPSWSEVSGSTSLKSAFMWVGDMLGNVVSRKMCGPLDSRESIKFYEHRHTDPVYLECGLRSLAYCPGQGRHCPWGGFWSERPHSWPWACPEISQLCLWLKPSPGSLLFLSIHKGVPLWMEKHSNPHSSEAGVEDLYTFHDLGEWCGSRSAGSLCYGSNRQILWDYRNPVQ